MVEGVSWKWTVLPVLARPRRSVNGTSTPCGNGCLAASRRAARRARRPPGAWPWPGCPGRSVDPGPSTARPPPGVVAEASSLPGLLEAAQIGVVAVDGQADRGAHRPAVPAVGGHQHRVLAEEPGQHRAGGRGDLTDDPAELAQPHGQGDRGQQRQGGQPPGVATAAAQVEVDGVVDGMGGVGNQEPGQRQGEPVAPGHRQHQGDPDAELEGPASWTKWRWRGKPAASANAVEQPVRVQVGLVRLDGDLATPAAAQGVVLFGHGSGSGRHSPRNRQVAAALGRAGFATLLLDLLTPAEEAADRASGQFRFDVELLAGRLLAAADWLAADQRTTGLPVGLFGASTGAGAALLAAAERPQAAAAVVSRGGRPDLAGAALGRVRAPTLLIVGALDPQVLELNRAALGRLGSEASLEIVPGASHLFEEPGTLEQVAELAVGWFTRWLAT